MTHGVATAGKHHDITGLLALKQGIFLQSLFDFLIQFQRRELQKPDRLLQLRGQCKMLRKPELESLLHVACLHLEVLAEIHAAHTLIIDDFFGMSSRKHFPGIDDGRAVTDAKRFPHVVVGDQYADAALF